MVEPKPRKKHKSWRRTKGKEGDGPWCPSCRHSFTNYGVILEGTTRTAGRYKTEAPDHYEPLSGEVSAVRKLILCGYCNELLWPAGPAAAVL